MTALGLLLGLVACSALSCVTVVVEDVDVTWSVDGSTDPSVCQTYGIDYWVVSLENGIDPTQSGQIPCETAVWAARFNDVEEDFYDVTIAAYDVGGNLIGEASQLEDIDGSLPSPDTFDYDLSPDTFAGAPKINVFWNINGTVDGSATGPSWDTCAEVGAVEVAVTVDGDTTTHNCDAGGNMSTTITGLQARTYTLSVALLDSAGAEITTSATATISATAQGGEFVAEFFYDSFFEPKRSAIEGDLHFTTTYEGGPCGQTTPPVEVLVTLLSFEDDTEVAAMVCDSTLTTCVEADGATEGTCTDAEQVIPDQIWGAYKLQIEGGINPGSETYCWAVPAEDQLVLLGAGDDNPLITLDLARLSGACE